MKNLTGTSRHIFGNIQIQIKNRTNGDHDQINNCRLFEIIFKRFKKAPNNISFLIPNHLQCHIIHSRNRCSGSNDRNTADQTDDIQNTQICHLIHKCKKLIVHTEKTSHMHSSFVSFFFSGLCRSLLYSITKFLKKSNQNQTAVLSLLYGRIS